MGVFSGSSAVLHQIFTDALASIERGALVDPNGQAIYLHSHAPADLATLPQTGALCHRYLKLNDGDVALTNDPYSGGTCLSDFTLVRGLRLFKSSNSIDFLLVSRIAHPPRLPFQSRLDEEGVRVPPTPLVTESQFNRDLLHAIAAHPLAPRTLFESIATELERMELAVKILKRLAEDPSTLLSAQGIKTYLDDSRRIFESFLSRLPLGNATVSHQMKTGETLKLQLKINEDQVVFDFAGTDSSTQFGLTDLTTFGACWASLVGSLDAAIPPNAGTFQGVHVSAPTKSFLSASAPTSTTRGTTEGVALVARLVNQALGRLRSSVLVAPAPAGNGCYQFNFKDGRQCTLWPATGQGARADGPGTNAWSFLQPQRRGLNAEALETQAGLEVISFDLRKNSGGAGKYRGGQGLVLHLRITSPCELIWHDPSLAQSYPGISGGRPGTPAALEVFRKGSTEREEHLEPQGRLEFAPGDELYILTGGGGGYGEAAVQDAEDSID